MLINSPASCFVDACELAFGLEANAVRDFIQDLAPETECDRLGYHSTFLGIAMLELYKIGITKIDARPVDQFEDDQQLRPGSDKVEAKIIEWFGRPGFRCVVQGPRIADRVEHANAWNNGYWIDPAKPNELMDEPNVNVRHVWVVTVPPATEIVTETETEEPDGE